MRIDSNIAISPGNVLLAQCLRVQWPLELLVGRVAVILGILRRTRNAHQYSCDYYREYDYYDYMTTVATTRTFSRLRQRRLLRLLRTRTATTMTTTTTADATTYDYYHGATGSLSGRLGTSVGRLWTLSRRRQNVTNSSGCRLDIVGTSLGRYRDVVRM